MTLMDGEVGLVRVWGGALTPPQVAATMLDSWKTHVPERVSSSPPTYVHLTSSSSSRMKRTAVPHGNDDSGGEGAAGAGAEVIPTGKQSEAGMSPPLVGSWHLQEGSGETFHDSGPVGRHGVFAAAPHATPGVKDEGGPEWISSEAVRGGRGGRAPVHCCVLMCVRLFLLLAECCGCPDCLPVRRRGERCRRNAFRGYPSLCPMNVSSVTVWCSTRLHLPVSLLAFGYETLKV